MPKVFRNRQKVVGHNSAFEVQQIRIAKHALIIQILGTIFTILSIIFLGIQLQEQIKSTEAQTEATRAQYESIDNSVYQDLMAKQLELDKLLIEKPKLHKLLFSVKEIDSDKWPDGLAALADYHLDFYQLIFSQRSRLPALHAPNGDWLTWENMIRVAFENSFAMCARLSENRAMYGADLTNPALSIWCKPNAMSRH